jgi:hypothetical protein
MAQLEETKKWSEEIVQAIQHARLAHTEHGNKPEDAIRFHDRVTPYFVHPMWCAASLLQESTLPLAFRKSGYMALLWHDVLEDTRMGLPDSTPPEVVELVKDMSFDSFDQERTELWSRSAAVKLLKLYDKVSNLLDGGWMKAEKWNLYVDHTLRLAKEVQQSHGLLNIVKIAEAIAIRK